jgi:hypothetical protein
MISNIYYKNIINKESNNTFGTINIIILLCIFDQNCDCLTFKKLERLIIYMIVT